MRAQLKIDASLTDDLVLWRYMDLAKLVSLLCGEIWLARADTFKDRHEGRFPHEMRDLLREAYKTLPPGPGGAVKDADDFQDYLLKNSFISCWHRNSRESLAMWEIYGRDASAVAIQTSVGRLRRVLTGQALHGFALNLKPVIYKNADEVHGELRYEDCFFIKRTHYEFEQEVRLSLDTYSRSTPRKDMPYGIGVPVDVNVLVENIYVHPDCADWYFDVVCSVAEKYGASAGVTRGTAGNK